MTIKCFRGMYFFLLSSSHEGTFLSPLKNSVEPRANHPMKVSNHGNRQNLPSTLIELTKEICP